MNKVKSFIMCMLLLMPITVLANDSLLYYILDGSGSMWGRVDGRPKIQIAKEVMEKLINETPDTVHGGVMSYGHRKKGDCSDIEEIVPIGLINKADAIAKIRSISPKGMTPVSDSIKLAVDKIKSSEYKTTIVLVSDGIETCDKDPCSLTRELKEAGIDFVLHVVGFDVASDKSQQLACIAEAGGGNYFSSSNASELLRALNKIKQSVVAQKELSTPEPTATPTAVPVKQEITSSSKSIRIKAKGPGRITIKHDSWLKAPYYWTLVSPESGKEIARFKDLDTQLVSPGDYQIVWRQTEHGGREVELGEVLTIEAGKTTEVALKTAIKLILPQWVKEPDFWSLVDIHTGKKVSYFKSLEPQLVPSGDYELLWKQTEHSSAAITLGKVSIEPDKVNEVKFSTAINLQRAPWVSEDVREWALLNMKGGKRVARFHDNFAPQLVIPGKFRILYRASEHGTSNTILGEIEIVADKMNGFPVNTGVKIVPLQEMEKPYWVQFIQLNSEGKAIDRTTLRESFGPIALAPGTYKIMYQQKQHGSSKIELVDSFELPEGSLVEIEM